MSWLILIIAGLCETGFAFCLGKTKYWQSATRAKAWVADLVFEVDGTIVECNTAYGNGPGDEKQEVTATNDPTDLFHRIDKQHGVHTIEHAEAIGLGSRKYTIINIDK